ncbi:MAG: hypothetical protein DRJ42_19180, partial [Deltaproteobacteria bacterium]
MHLLAHLRFTLVPVLTALAAVLLNGCFLLDGLGGGGDDTPADTRLVVGDGQRLHWLGHGGLEPATEPFAVELSMTNLATSADRSRVVIAGVDTEAGDHGVWILQGGAFYERLAVDVARSVVGPDARW